MMLRLGDVTEARRTSNAERRRCLCLTKLGLATVHDVYGFTVLEIAHIMLRNPGVNLDKISNNG